jgi:L-fuculose-phosphate aldolase
LPCHNPRVMPEAELRSQMCEVGRRLWQRGLIGATEGNFSARLDDKRLLCTPSGLSKGHMSPEDLLIIDMEGSPLVRGKPSSEIKMHLRLFQKRPDCMAVVHAHPPVATGFTLAGEPIPDDLLPESMYVLGPVATVPFGMPGTNEVPDGLEPYLDGHKTFLLSHHGAVVMGNSLMDACYRMETLERVAQIVLTARVLGGANPLAAADFQRLATLLHGRL